MFNKFKIKKSQEEVYALIEDFVQLVPSTYQHIGDRESQEDAFALSDLMDRKIVVEKGVLAVVADGMGGLDYGEEASRVAVKVFLRECLTGEEGEPTSERLYRALLTANAAVFDSAYKDGIEVNLGTTLVAALVHKRELHWISVGDSRIYLFRNKLLMQLNKEHIYQNKLMEEVENGILNMSEAENHPEGSYLTSYLGLPELTEVDRSRKPLLIEPGDRVILSSDGLNNTMSTYEIEQFFSSGDQLTAEALVNRALEKKQLHQDNITVVILSCNSYNI